MGPENRQKKDLGLGLNSSTALDDTFSPPGAARGPFWTQFELILGFILGSIWGSRARAAIFVKSSTAPRREHDFHDSGCPKQSQNKVQNGSGNSLRCHASSKRVLGACWGPLGLDFGSILDPKIDPRSASKWPLIWGPIVTPRTC